MRGLCKNVRKGQGGFSTIILAGIIVILGGIVAIVVIALV